MKRIIVLLLLLPLSAFAQSPIAARVVSSCGAAGYSSGQSQAVTQDVNGNICTAAAAGGSTTANQGTAGSSPWPVLNYPSSAAAAGIAEIASTAAESNHVLKASAGNLYSVTVTIGATSGYLMVFNAMSAPADGAVTPAYCVALPATNTSLAVNWSMPANYSTGITAVFSSTGCFTKTASATAAFFAQVQ